MTQTRSMPDDRRQALEIPKIPFKDSGGTTIMQCRRESPDRRSISSMQAELINMFHRDRKVYS